MGLDGSFGAFIAVDEKLLVWQDVVVALVIWHDEVQVVLITVNVAVQPMWHVTTQLLERGNQETSGCVLTIDLLFLFLCEWLLGG